MSPYEVSTCVVERAERMDTEERRWGYFDILFDFCKSVHVLE
jgi:hypothetical protein